MQLYITQLDSISVETRVQLTGFGELMCLSMRFKKFRPIFALTCYCRVGLTR